MGKLKEGYNASDLLYLIYNYKYRGTVKGIGSYFLPPQLDQGKLGEWTEPNGTTWFSGIIVTP